MDITSQEFAKEVLQSKLPVLVEFWASWCLPCQTTNLLLQEMGKDYQGKFKVVKINLDRNPIFSSQYHITGVPTFVVFKKGKEVQRKVGAQSRNDLCRMIKKFLDKEKGEKKVKEEAKVKQRLRNLGYF